MVWAETKWAKEFTLCFGPIHHTTSFLTGFPGPGGGGVAAWGGE